MAYSDSLTPEELIAWARSVGVPEEAQVARVIYVIGPRSAQAQSGWPAGTATFLGAAVAVSPKPHPRPIIDRGESLLDVYWAAVVPPSRRAWAIYAWAPRVARIELLPGAWKSADLKKAEAALRWLESLSTGQGRTPDYTDENEPLFFSELKAASHEAVEQGEHVNYSTLKRHGLAASRTTVKTRVETFGYDLKAIEYEASQCTRKLNSCAFIWRHRAKFKKNGA
jgi:hypothetical protein